MNAAMRCLLADLKDTQEKDCGGLEEHEAIQIIVALQFAIAVVASAYVNQRRPASDNERVLQS